MEITSGKDEDLSGVDCDEDMGNDCLDGEELIDFGEESAISCPAAFAYSLIWLGLVFKAREGDRSDSDASEEDCYESEDEIWPITDHPVNVDNPPSPSPHPQDPFELVLRGVALFFSYS